MSNDKAAEVAGLIEKALAAGPTPDWEMARTGVIVGGVVKTYANGSCKSQILMLCVTDDDGENKQFINAQFVIAANPANLRILLDELAATTKDRDEWKESTIDANRRFKQAESALAAAKVREAGLVEALEEIALAGMSPSPEMSENGIDAWHARQAWRFIGIAARALPVTTEIAANQEAKK